MLTLNTPLNGLIEIGYKFDKPSELILRKVNLTYKTVTLTIDGVKVVLGQGQSKQVLPHVVVHCIKVMSAGDPIVRLGIEAPRTITIQNTWRKPAEINFASMSDRQLIAHGRLHSKTPLEDELLNRLESSND